MNSVFALAAAAASASALTVEESHIGRFNNWKATHGKEYANINEEEARFEVFMENDRLIEAHNAQTEVSFTLAHNEFSDMTSEEFGSVMTGYKAPADHISNADNVHDETAAPAPGTIDWRKSNVVTPVKNQGQCGSCWAFSTTGSVEAANLIKNKGSNTDAKNILSEQQLVDCSHNGNMGCRGGLMDTAFQYLKGLRSDGDDTEGSYPYQARNMRCRANKGTPSHIQVTGFTDVRQNEEALKNAVGTVGPVSVAIQANQPAFQFYSGGVIRSGCGQQLDHGVLVVGYTEDAWIVKNSWGASWGEEGYVRIERGKNLCGIKNSASYPQVA